LTNGRTRSGGALLGFALLGLPGAIAALMADVLVNPAFVDEPASACLSSRIPYGSEVTDAALRQIEQAEQVLRDLGFRIFRVRHHDLVARLEIARTEMPRALDPARKRQPPTMLHHSEDAHPARREDAHDGPPDRAALWPGGPVGHHL